MGSISSSSSREEYSVIVTETTAMSSEMKKERAWFRGLSYNRCEENCTYSELTESLYYGTINLPLVNDGPLEESSQSKMKALN